MNPRPQLLDYIDTIYLPVKDKQETINWYEEKLGLTWNGICFNLGTGPTIMLVTATDPESANLTYLTNDWEGTDYPMQLVTFKTSDIDTAHQQLTARGVEVSTLNTYDNNRKNFRFYDLNGNRFDVWSGWL